MHLKPPHMCSCLCGDPGLGQEHIGGGPGLGQEHLCGGPGLG
jgi:hypothetical protein